ncbi:MAG: CoA-binding protein [Deltaproteobacteria bacterium]|nr:CoA-binding protein [Deltaproteobacteria bacterium]
MLQTNLQALFEPSQVAVVGASANPGKIGHSIMANMLEAEFGGNLIPVNPKADDILGRKCVHRIPDLPRGLDLAVIAVPRDGVIPSLKDLASIETKSVIVITAGFKEVGREGHYLEEEMIGICRKSGMALIGPNCLGVINIAAGLNASFAAGTPKVGNIAFFSQSGALCTAILDWALGENIGFSKFVSLGNKAVINEAHMLDYLGNDPATSIILGYIENVSDGRRFLEAARATTVKKPVVLIKSGTTAAGAKAASSHTGAIAGSDQAYSAAFRQCGVIRALDISTLFNLAQAFSSQPLPLGPNLGIVTNSGGPGIMTADACERSSLNMASISPTIVERLQAVLPPYANFYNPVDIIGDAGAERYGKAIEIVLQDPHVHSLLVLLTPTAQAAEELEPITRSIIEAAKTGKKPVFASFMGKKRISVGQKMLVEAGIPCYDFPEPAIASIEAMHKYADWQKSPAPAFETMDADKELVARIIQEARYQNSLDIVEFQAHEILRAYDLPAPKTILARSSAMAVRAAQDIGHPVVLKIASPQISHKSDVGGVKVNLQNDDDVLKAFRDITSRAQRLRPEAYITGCLVQEMAPKGAKEIIVGFKRDEQFGPLLMFGLGGIYVEILKDISFRLAPLSRQDAQNMIREIHSYMLLKGVRGEKSVKFSAIEDILLAMSQLALDFPDICEAEFNPVLVTADKALVADVRLTLCPPPRTDTEHLDASEDRP